MTDQEIARIGTAFGTYLGQYRSCFLQKRTATHFDNYCRGLLSDLDRKTVEPIALACGTAVRTLQEFLVTAAWDHEQARDLLQRHLADRLPDLPADDLGTVGVIDETSCLKKGDQTPGVQRQYLGCVGKLDNGIVTVHVGVAKGRFHALLDADLYLPKVWDGDRDRCRAAGIPDAVRYRAKWRIALHQLIRLHGNGVHFDWLTFDEGYGSKVPFLAALSLVGQKFVAEVPISFQARRNRQGAAQRADAILTKDDAQRGRRFRLRRQTSADQVWRAVSVPVWVKNRPYVLVAAINEATAEVKYLLSNVPTAPLRRLLAVAFRRATIEQLFRVGKQEAGLMHYEGRPYGGLVRHLSLALIVMGFVSVHTERLRGEKSPGDDGAGMSGVEPAVCDVVTPPSGRERGTAHREGDPVSSTSERPSRSVSQETAA